MLNKLKPYTGHLLITVLVIAIIYIVFSQVSGIGKPGILLYTITKWQASFNKEVVAKIRSLQANYSMELFMALLTTSFLYGVLHAAGPGHGKSIITGWILTQSRSFKDITLASLSATFLHAFSAVAVVAGIYLFMGKYAPAAMGTTLILLNLAAGGLLILSGLQLFHTVWQQRLKVQTNKMPSPNADLPVKQSGFTHSLWIGVSIGIVPCPLAAVIFLFCLNAGLMANGLALVTAFALGMGLTLFAVALTVWSTKQKATQGNEALKTDGFLFFVNLISGLFFIAIGIIIILPNLEKIL